MCYPGDLCMHVTLTACIIYVTLVMVCMMIVMMVTSVRCDVCYDGDECKCVTFLMMCVMLPTIVDDNY